MFSILETKKFLRLPLEFPKSNLQGLLNRECLLDNLGMWGKCVVRETLIWGLSQAQGALCDMGCGLLHPLLEKGPQRGKMPFPRRPGGGGL